MGGIIPHWATRRGRHPSRRPHLVQRSESSARRVLCDHPSRSSPGPPGPPRAPFAFLRHTPPTPCLVLSADSWALHRPPPRCPPHSGSGSSTPCPSSTT